MHFQEGTACDLPQIKIENILPEIGNDELIKDILEGLTCANKHISSKFFYDEVGSKLFEEITRLPEYYIPRIEKSLIREAAIHLQESLKDRDIIEFGCGDCSKISLLLQSVPEENLDSIRYIPVDISPSAVQESVETLLDNYFGLEVHGILADFVKQVESIPGKGKRIFCMFGSTIGNLSREQGVQFCASVSKNMRPGDIFLLGMDMVKNRDVMYRAYNDHRNVTAKFNGNILNVVNALLGTNLDPNYFKHLAFFNEKQARIEMHLRAMKDIETFSPYSSTKITVKNGETIHTENSHKFTKEHINELAKTAGLKVQKIFTDKDNWFSLVQFTKDARRDFHD